MCLLAAAGAGCDVNARVELSAATAIEQVAAGLATAVEEYHVDLTAADDRREDAVVSAFVERVRRDHEAPSATDAHAADFRRALHRIRQDRDVEFRRYATTSANISTLLETTGGLRRLAVESMTLSDEARRYLRGLIEAVPRAGAAPSGSEENHVVGNGFAGSAD